MIVIPPQQVNDVTLVSSSVPEPYTYPDWISAHTYVGGDYVVSISESQTPTVFYCMAATTSSTVLPYLNTSVWYPVSNAEVEWSNCITYGRHVEGYTPVRVIRTTTHTVYESLVTNNLDKVPESNPNYWFPVGPTNKWAVLDGFRTTKTKAGTSINMVITLDRGIDSVGLVGLTGATKAVVNTTDLTGVVQSKTIGLSTRDDTPPVTGWWKFFVSGSETPVVVIKNIVDTTIKGYIGKTIDITIHGTAALQCGSIVLGRKVYIGSTQAGIGSEALNFSTITRDNFGNAIMIPRRSIPKTNQQLYLDNELIDTVVSVREELNAVPALWVGLEKDPDDPLYNSSMVYGFYRQFKLSFNNQIATLVDLELEEI